MTADTLGGVWTYALELISGLQAYDIQVSLITFGAMPDHHQLRQAAGLNNLKLYPTDWKLEWMQNPWEDIASGAAFLLNLKDSLNPDIIHLNHLAHGHLKWDKPVVTVVHSCVLSWWNAVKNEHTPGEWLKYKDLVESGLHLSDRVIAPSHYMLRETIKNYGSLKSAEVIYNGRNSSLFKVAEKEPFIFSMGRLWDEAKNVQALCRIASMLPLPVYIAGDALNPGTGKTEKFKNVHFLGKLSSDEVAGWLSRAAVYCLPALYEPFGLSLLEAALSECRIVCSSIDSLKEIWGESVIYANPRDELSLFESISKAIHDYANTGESFKKASLYTPRRMSEAYYKTYLSLAGKPLINQSSESVIHQSL
jgi:glycosyltransferase involved in cell wall biosynthesis